MLWVPNADWEGRLIFSSERARDGDYALNDVALLRANPFHGGARLRRARQSRRLRHDRAACAGSAGPISFSSTTGFVDWRTQDVTDLDYTPAPLITRDNTEDDFQFTQEFRFASADSAPLTLGDNAQLRWQIGTVSLHATTTTRTPSISSRRSSCAPFPVTQHSPRSELDDFGVGLFGQGTVTFGEPLRSRGRRPVRLRKQERHPRDLLRSAAHRAGTRGRRRELLERVAADLGCLPPAAGQDGVRDGRARLQGRRLQPGVAGR